MLHIFEQQFQLLGKICIICIMQPTVLEMKYSFNTYIHYMTSYCILTSIYQRLYYIGCGDINGRIGNYQTVSYIVVLPMTLNYMTSPNNFNVNIFCRKSSWYTTLFHTCILKILSLCVEKLLFIFTSVQQFGHVSISRC